MTGQTKSGPTKSGKEPVDFKEIHKTLEEWQGRLQPIYDKTKAPKLGVMLGHIKDLKAEIDCQSSNMVMEF